MKSVATTKFKEIEIGPIPKKWDVLPLIKMGYLVQDSCRPTEISEVPYIGLEHIDQQTLSLNSVGKSSDVTSNKYVFDAGDILFGKLRPYFRKVYRPKFSGVCSTDIWVIRAKEGIDQGFLYYFFANEEFVKAASSGSGGTRMPRADWSHLADTEWPTPPESEQKQIAEILSALDDKIELNRQMSKTVEETAQALFKHWFVDFEFPGADGKPYKSSGGKMVESELGEIPEGWRTGIFSDVADVATGKRPEEKLENRTLEFNVPLLGASSVMGYVKDVLYHEPIIVTGRVGTHGVLQRIMFPCWPSDNTLVIKSKCLEFAYQIMRGFDFSSLNRGSTQPLITQTDVKNLKIIIPSEKILNDFNKIVLSFFDLVFNNEKEIENLARMRDSLLPRLMNGKIRVER